MARVEPVPGAPAAVADCGDERALVVADYHAGLEAALRWDGVELRSRADERREELLDLLDRTGADRAVFLGDLGNAIGDPPDAEREELDALLSALAERVPVTVVKGNHDAEFEELVADLAVGVDVTPAAGTVLGSVGFAHGHTWPAPEVVEADAVCVAHEHPVVRLEDEVGGARTERAWLRGRVASEPFEAQFDRAVDAGGDLVVFPAFNDRTGGTWVNEADDLLSPFLPEGMSGVEAYLLDGTRLGDYARV